MSAELVIALATGAGVAGLALAAAALARLVRGERSRDVAATLGLVAAVGLAAGGLATAGALLRRPDAVRPGPSPAIPPTPAPLRDVHGGRALAEDPTRLADAQDVEWPLLRMRLRVPADWVVRRLSATEVLVHDPVTPTTFVAARAAPLPAGPTVAEYLDAHVAHLRTALDDGRIAGFTTRHMGTMPGVLALEHRDADGGWAVTWTGFEPAQVGSLAVTITAGASDDAFVRDEALLGAVLASIRFD